MFQPSYPDRDYQFGQLMLRLRTEIGLTQTALAGVLGVSRRAIIKWEDGSNYPKAPHLKEFIALAYKRQCFQTGHEIEEIRSLWFASHQKNLLDEIWLAKLLAPPSPSQILTLTASEIRILEPAPLPTLLPQKDSGPRFDWADAQAVQAFYGRELELDLLTEWVASERCQVISLLGMGGIGKSALAVTLMHRLAGDFEVVIWRSLRDAEKCEDLLDDITQGLAPQYLGSASLGLERRISLLLEQLRNRRVLLVLDNLESLLMEGPSAGKMQSGYDGYGQFLRRIAETNHQSCLVLTSREKPADLVSFEGNRSPVRTLSLARLSVDACEQLLDEKEVNGTFLEKESLIEAYNGNPLALKIVAQTIVEVFGGEIALFLNQGEVIFGEVRELLDQQFERLSELEQSILLWLAIMREPVTFEELVAVSVRLVSRARLIESVGALRRRSLIERGHQAGSFTLQSVVLEYATTRLILEATSEIKQGKLVRLLQHNLTQAHAKDYIRQSQERLLVIPLLATLESELGEGKAALLTRFNLIFNELRNLDEVAQGYGPSNIVALVGELKEDLTGLNLAGLVLRDVYLQGVAMQDTNLAGATVRDSVFSETFGSLGALNVSPTGEFLVATNSIGEVILWKTTTQSLHRVWKCIPDINNGTCRFAISPDGRTIVTGVQLDGIKVWDLESGNLKRVLFSNTSQHVRYEVDFSPDGRKIAGVIAGKTVCIWDAITGRELYNLPHPNEIPVLLWSPDGRKLAVGEESGVVRLWDIPESGEGDAVCLHTLESHTRDIADLAFAPDGQTLASGSWDGTVKLWDVAVGHLLQTLTGHKDRVSRLAWSPDGRILASGGRNSDPGIWLWDVAQGSYRMVLAGHQGVIRGLGFTPDSSRLVSGSSDGTVRIWDMASCQCIKKLENYRVKPLLLDWSPDGKKLVSSQSDSLIAVYDLTGNQPKRFLRGTIARFAFVVWSPDGRWIATSELNNAFRLWDARTGEMVHLFEQGGRARIEGYDLQWSRDSRWLASTTPNSGVIVWDVLERRQRWIPQPFPTDTLTLDWSPDGTRIASTSKFGNLYIQDATNGTILQELNAGPDYFLNNPMWSPDGKYLAVPQDRKEDGDIVLIWETETWERVPLTFSGAEIENVDIVFWGDDGKTLITCTENTLHWWDAKSGECLRTCEIYEQGVNSVAKSLDDTRLATSSNDGNIKIWDITSGELLQTIRLEQLYERLNITGIKGLTEAQKANLRTLGALDETGLF